MSLSVPIEFPVDYIPRGDGTVRTVYADESNRVSVRFVKRRVPDVQKMLLTGQEEWAEEVLLLKKVRGSSNVPASRATEADKRTYRKEWDLFVKHESGKNNGHSLIDVYGFRPSDVAALASIDIHTIPELLDAEESLLLGVSNGPELKQLAAIFQGARDKEEASKTAIIHVETYRKKATELEEEVLRLRSELETKTKSKKKGV